MSKFFEGLAAAAFGLLVGLLVGLSVSPVVGGVLGVVVAAAMVYLGVGAHTTRATPGRIFGFALGCTSGVLGGIAMRSHSILSPSISSQIRELETAGIPKEDARAIVLSKYLDIPSSARDSDHRTVPSRTLPTQLFAGSAEQARERCAELNPNRYKNDEEVIRAYRSEGWPWTEIATYAERAPESERRAVLQFLWRLRCEQ